MCVDNERGLMKLGALKMMTGSTEHACSHVQSQCAPVFNVSSPGDRQECFAQLGDKLESRGSNTVVAVSAFAQAEMVKGTRDSARSPQFIVVNTC